jgi:glyoxylase-like metal-dependent hydrolase (beta-lactamase superfamily II)
MFLRLGQDADLLIDSGMGIAPLRPFVDQLRPDPDRPLISLSTHTHVDHIGAVHEFDTRLVHPLEADDLANPTPYSLRSDDIPQPFRDLFTRAGYPPLWPLLIDAVPHEVYDIDGYTLRGATATGTVVDGDIIDLGNWQAEVLHLPGHSPGQVGLFHHDSGTLFGADAMYDGPLIYDAPGMDVAAYAATLRKLAALPVTRIHGGHDPSFDRPRMDAIIDHYLRLWEA